VILSVDKRPRGGPAAFALHRVTSNSASGFEMTMSRSLQTLIVKSDGMLIKHSASLLSPGSRPSLRNGLLALSPRRFFVAYYSFFVVRTQAVLFCTGPVTEGPTDPQGARAWVDRVGPREVWRKMRLGRLCYAQDVLG
jgi:hypothetical protein